MKQELLQKIYDNFDNSALEDGIYGYITTMLQPFAEFARASFAADACVFIGINPMTNRMLSPIIIIHESHSTHIASTDEIHFYVPDLNQHLDHKRAWVVETSGELASEQSSFAVQEHISMTAAIVLQREQKVGILYLHFRERACEEDVSQILEAFAAQHASYVLDFWHHYHYSQVEAIEHEINRNLSSVEDLFASLQLYLPRVLDYRYSLLLAVYTWQGNTFNTFVNEGEQTLTRRNTYSDQGACRYAVQTKETLFIKSLSQEQDSLPYRIVHVKETLPKECFIFIPLILRSDIFGVLSIQHSEPNTFSEQNLPALKLLANHTALALRNISLYNNLQRLNTTGRVFLDLLDSAQLLQAIVKQIQEDTQADVVVLYPYDAELQEFVLPPLLAGELLSPRLRYMDLRRSDNIVHLMVKQTKIIFAHNSSELYTIHLQGDLNIRQGSFEERERIRSTVAVTLRSGQELVGALFLNFRQPQRFDRPQKLFIAALTNYVSIAIRTAQTIGTVVARHAGERELLKEIDQEVNRSLDLDHVLTTILERAKILLKADEASILLYDSETRVLEVKAVLPVDAGQGQIIPLEASRGITRLALNKKESILVHDVNDPAWCDLYVPTDSNLHAVSELDVPLIDEKEVVGIMNFESMHKSAFDHEDQKFLEVLAGHTVLAVKRARDFEAQKRLAMEALALNEISKDIIGQYDARAVFEAILQSALKLTNATIGSLHLYHAETQDLSIEVEQGIDEKMKDFRHQLGQGIVGWVLQTREPLNIDSTSLSWPLYIPFAEGIYAELAVPMIAGTELRGVLNVESHTHRFHSNDQKLLVSLANLAVIALEHTERHKNALREKKRFELLYQAAQALGKLSELEHIKEAYSITQQFAQKYDEKSVSLFQSNDLPAKIPADLIFSISFNEDHYGYLLLSPHGRNASDEVDRTFFDGLTQQLANTIYRIETAYSKRENESKALLTSFILEVVHRSGNRLGLVTSYVNDIRSELERLKFSGSVFIEQRLSRITQSVHKIRTMNKDVMHSMNHIQPATTEVILVTDLFDEVKQEMQERLTSAPWPILLQCDEGNEDLYIYAIRIAIVNSLYNLVTNAIDAMPDGGTIVLRAYKDSSFIALEVSDTGYGIPADLHEKIFFFGYSARKNSTGFGLWNAAWSARINHGNLKLVTSEQGTGSTFRLLVPNAENRNRNGETF